MKSFIHTSRTAIRALRRNVMRSALTTLGIVIGVGAVIAMVEIGQGSKTAIAQTIQSMGANNLLIQPGQATSGGVSFGSGSSTTLTPEDAETLRRELGQSAISVAPVVRARTQVVFGNKNWVPLYIYGTTSEFLDVREWEVSDGRSFTPQESTSSAGACMIGQTIARELFGDESPIGQSIRINSQPLQVIGVLARKGANMMGVDQDDIVLAPWRTIKFKVSGQSAQTANQSAATATTQTATTSSRTLFPSQQPSSYPQKSPTEADDHPVPPLPTYIDQILVRVRSEAEIPGVMQQIKTLLRERHRLRPGQPEDFNIRDMAEISRAMGSTSELMGGLLLCVALISLVVGGVGIMNIMLVSVTERTREIGLRMAVGARGRDILQQFLTEAVLLCLIGGLIGIALGRAGSWMVRLLLNWRTEPSLAAIAAAAGVSLVVGVVFGFYPAWKASRLDPIEALRYE